MTPHAPPRGGGTHRPGRGGRKLAPRYLRRESSDRESHAGPGALAPGPIAAHPLASPDPPTMVATQPALAEAIARLRAAGAFAFDSEFIGELTYEPRLCLVQAATRREVFVLDPLSGLDLAAFWGLLADAAIEKIVHCGQQDFALAVRRTGRSPANVLDVQIAAGFVHAEYPLSLARLVAEFAGVPLGKAHTFTHWDRRPLSAAQVRYAADDVRYLPAAREEIGRLLLQRGRTAWAREECAAMLEDLSLYRSAPETLYLRVRGHDRLGRRALAVLRELATLRDQIARQEDVPPRTLLTDGVLRALARRPVRTVDDLDAVLGLPRPVERQYGRQIVAATQRAMALPQDRLPPMEPPETHALLRRVEAVWPAIQRRCLEAGLAPPLVAAKKEVARLCQAPVAGQPPAPSRLLQGWRKELLGDLLESLR